MAKSLGALSKSFEISGKWLWIQRKNRIPPSPPVLYLFLHLQAGDTYTLIPKSVTGAPMNREVNLTKRVQTAHGWRYCRVVLSASGRVKPEVVIVSGKQEIHKEGAYYLEWRGGSK